jgi:hypothetical protein
MKPLFHRKSKRLAAIVCIVLGLVAFLGFMKWRSQNRLALAAGAQSSGSKAIRPYSTPVSIRSKLGSKSQKDGKDPMIAIKETLKSECDKARKKIPLSENKAPAVISLQAEIIAYRQSWLDFCETNQLPNDLQLDQLETSISKITEGLHEFYGREESNVFDRNVSVNNYLDYIPFFDSYEDESIRLAPDSFRIAAVSPIDSERRIMAKAKASTSNDWVRTHHEIFFACHDLEGFDWKKAYREFDELPEVKNPIYKKSIQQGWDELDSMFSPSGAYYYCACGEAQGVIDTAESLMAFLKDKPKHAQKVKDLSVFLEKARRGLAVRDKYPEGMDRSLPNWIPVIPEELVIIHSHAKEECRSGG